MIELSPSQLTELADALASRLAECMSAQSALVDYHGLADWLGVSVPHVERLKREGAIPYVSAGRRVLFDRAAVANALTKKARATDDDASLKRHPDSTASHCDTSDTTLVCPQKNEVVSHGH